MEEKERKELIEKILNVDKDAKSARVAATVFVNKATKEEAKFFLDYLDHYDADIKKIARSIVGQLGLQEGCDVLIKEFNEVVGSLNFMPDEEYKESQYYQNLVDILETVFTIVRVQGCHDEAFHRRIIEIFKKTKSEDLRFTLIKLLATIGGQFEYFMKIYDDLTDKERRALYYVYTLVKEPGRMDVYKKGLHDDRNFDYVVTNMLSFEEGRALLSSELLSLGNYSKQNVLKKLRDGKYPEFNDVLIKLLNDKNKYLVEMAIEILKINIADTAGSEESLKPFISLIETGYSPEGIAGALEIIAHCVKRHPEDIYLSGLEQQPAHKNKNIILEFFVEQLKTNLKPTEELSEKVLPKLLVYFDNYSKEKEDLFISIFKIIPSLKYDSSAKLRAAKKKVVGFKNEFENRVSKPFKNNLSEFVVKINQAISRFEESESKLKNIVILFDIDPGKIDHPRMLKLKDQLQEVELDDETLSRLVKFLASMFDVPRIDWKVKSVAVELLGDYGGPTEMAKLMEAAESESSLAIKVNAQKAVTKIEDRHAALIQNVLIVEPLPYIQKKLGEFFKSQAFKVYYLNEVKRFSDVSKAPFGFLVVSESMMVNDEFTQSVFDYLDEHFETVLIIVTAKPEEMQTFEGIPNVRFLKKPFTDETLMEAIKKN